MGRYRFGLAATLLVASPLASASDSERILQQLTSIAPMIMAISAFVGLLLFASGIFRVYQRSTNPNQHTTASAIRLLVAGTLLLCLPATINMFSKTVVDPNWSGTARSIMAVDENALRELDSINQTPLGRMMPEGMGKAVIGFLYLFGFFFFVWGIYLIKDAGDRQAQVSVGKVITHIAGGILLMNLTWSACIIGSIFGLTGMCT